MVQKSVYPVASAAMFALLAGTYRKELKLQIVVADGLFNRILLTCQ